MARTERQRLADQRLNEAIQETAQAYHVDGGPQGSLGPWLVIAAEVWFDEDGDPRDTIALLHRDGSLQNHVAIGLVEAARAILKRGLLNGDADD